MWLVMDPDVQRILDQAQSLSPMHRAVLAAAILESLHGTPDPDAGRRWDEEADLRLQELEDGRVKPISSDTLRERILGDQCPPAS